MKQRVKNILASLGYAIELNSSVECWKEKADQLHRIGLYMRMIHACKDRLDHTALSSALQCLSNCKSQIGQDLFCLLVSDFKHKGFFVEIGAADGLSCSNSYILEKEYDWSGILVEPAKGWHKSLRTNRSSVIDERCLYSTSRSMLDFREVSNGFGTIVEFAYSDRWASTRRKGLDYKVESISLADLLVAHNAPSIVDFMSIDTEGSEFEILGHFDFSRFAFRCITVEHNYTHNRDRIEDLLTSHGYAKVTSLETHMDDWYLNTQLLQSRLHEYLIGS